MLNNIYTETQQKMEKSIEKLKHEFASIRTSRASAALLSDIKVEYYGTQIPLQQVSNIAIPEARLIEIKPWDPSILSEIEKAILKSSLGITPNNDGKIIRLTLPTLTEERRKELVKLVGNRAEEDKIAIRNIRRHVNDTFEGLKKDKKITEDECFNAHDHIQKMTDKYIKRVDEILVDKEAEIMEV